MGIAGALMGKFAAIHNQKGTGTPSWACDYPASNPFVGKEYPIANGMLLYGSAENLSSLAKITPPEFFKGRNVRDSYRGALDDATCQKDRYSGMETFFPNIAIGPIPGLLVAAALFARSRGLRVDPSPRVFLETLAVSNIGKFSIKGKRNQDYASNLELLRHSMPYVRAEVETLRPQVVILPETSWRLNEVKDAVGHPDCIVPLYQFQPIVLNVHLRKFDRQVDELRGAPWGEYPIAEWAARVPGIKEEGVWRYVAHVTSVLDSLPPIATGA